MRGRAAGVLVAAGLLAVTATGLAGLRPGSVPVAAAAEDVAFSESPGPVGEATGAERRQLWLIPLPGQSLLIHALVMRPKGEGPYPLAVINHGSSQSSPERVTFEPSVYPVLSQWFLEHGYAVVLPLRPGHGETGGPYLEDQGRCDEADYRRSGEATADSIAAAISYMRAQDFIAPQGTVVVGQSAGGWGALALAGRNMEGVSAVVGFAPGRGGHADGVPFNNCSPDRLVNVAARFGQTARTPVLWLVASNDTYFPPELSREMFEAYAGGGASSEFDLLNLEGPDGHLFINDQAAAAQWLPLLERFLGAAGPS